MSALDGRVIAIAGVGGGLGPLVAARARAAGRDGRRHRSRPGAARLARGRARAIRAERWDGRAVDLLDEDARRRLVRGAGRALRPGRRARPPGRRLARRAAAARGAARRLGPAPRPADPHRPAHHPRLPRPAGRRSEHGRFVLVSAKQAQAPSNSNAAYAAAKAAAEAWTLAFADGFEPGGATANIVVVEAILTPRMREENPDEDFPTFTPAEHVAEAIAFLCSDAAEKMNGQRLPAYHGPMSPADQGQSEGARRQDDDRRAGAADGDDDPQHPRPPDPRPAAAARGAGAHRLLRRGARRPDRADPRNAGARG